MELIPGYEIRWETSEAIRTDLLETFPYSGSTQKICYETHEFSAVCPFSGLPDIATVVVEYIPSDRCLELKSLKLYFLTYRNVGIFQEHATDRIFTDLKACLNPRWIKIKTIYATRGGIDATCTMEDGISA